MIELKRIAGSVLFRLIRPIGRLQSWLAGQHAAAMDRESYGTAILIRFAWYTPRGIFIVGYNLVHFLLIEASMAQERRTESIQD